MISVVQKLPHAQRLRMQVSGRTEAQPTAEEIAPHPGQQRGERHAHQIFYLCTGKDGSRMRRKLSAGRPRTRLRRSPGEQCLKYANRVGDPLRQSANAILDDHLRKAMEPNGIIVVESQQTGLSQPQTSGSRAGLTVE